MVDHYRSTGSTYRNLTYNVLVDIIYVGRIYVLTYQYQVLRHDATYDTLIWFSFYRLPPSHRRLESIPFGATSCD